jgi:lactate permease
MIGLGFHPVKAAALALLADTAPVAFGAIAIPITTLAQVTGLPQSDLGAMVGRQTPLVALAIPFALIAMTDGLRGLRQVWPAGLVAGVVFAIGQFVTSNYISVPLTDIVATLLSTGALVAFLRVWSPAEPLVAERSGGPRAAIAGAAAHDDAFERDVRGRRGGGAGDPAPAREMFMALAPYIIIIVILGLSNIEPFKTFLADRTHKFKWPGLHIVNKKGKPLMSLTYAFNWASAAGTALFVSGLLTMAVLRVRARTAARVFGETVAQMKWAIVTVMAVLALAYVMNQSGQTVTLGTWVAGAGSIFALFAGAIGWLGVAVTGSDTSSNALFGVLQITAAKSTHLSPVLLAAANSSGGVLGKMVSPQNLAVGTAAVGMVGREGELLRRVILWGLGLLVFMCLLVYLQSTSVLGWMVVGGNP